MQVYGPQLARLYNHRWSSYAQNAAPLLRSFFENRPVSHHHPSVLDLGCGTGHLALHFLETGCPVTGLDLSEEMLRWARLRCRRYVLSHQATFERRDIRRFDVSQPFGMAVSTYNTLNHLTFDELRNCFRSTSNGVVKGGWVLFDLNTHLGFTEWEEDKKTILPLDTLQVERTFNALTSTARLKVEGLDPTESFLEHIENYAHPIQDCMDLLVRSGFSRVYSARVDDLEKPLKKPEEERRVFLVAEK
jgi:SAM-dependent methyltransferase